MTDLTDRITETLRAHYWWFVGNLGVPGMPDRKGYKCSCGWACDGGDDPHAHVAAMIAAEVQPRIETVEQLDALPPLSVLREIGPAQSLWERRTTGWTGLAGQVWLPDVTTPPLPAIVLWHPDWSGS